MEIDLLTLINRLEAAVYPYQQVPYLVSGPPNSQKYKIAINE